MNGVHDMGGMHGFGPIPYEEDEPVFHHAWEGRVYAIRVSADVPFPGGFRYTIERMDPALYLSSSYYERWLESQVRGFIAAGTFTRVEYEDRVAYFRAHPEEMLPQQENPTLVHRVKAALKRPVSHRKDVGVEPAFAIGDAVRTKNMHPTGHTRLPRYARGKRGEVVNYYGVQAFDDNTSAGIEPAAQPLYSVRFAGTELWGESAEPNSALYLDMWESYLESV